MIQYKIPKKGVYTMKGIIKKVAAVLLAAPMLVAAAACAGLGGDNNAVPTEKVDKNRTQLYVFNYHGGYGSQWLLNVKKEFEELHKDDDWWETGKKGVQIMIHAAKKDIIPGGVPGGQDEVFFAETAYYYTFKQFDALEDITEAVTGEIEGDNGKSIESKLTAEQKAYYGLEESDGKVHYYGLPHYDSFAGIMYNKAVFDKYLLYFAAEPDEQVSGLEKYFVFRRFDNNEVTAKSVGPDGEPGTDDDGLPSTFDEFWILMKYMREKGVTPIVWNGYRYHSYLNWFLQALTAQYEGLDEMMKNFTLTGEANDLGSVDGEGNFVFDDEPTELTDSKDGVVALSRQAGKYYALKFLQELVSFSKDKDGGYTHKEVYNEGYMHTMAQRDFIVGAADGHNQDIGMLIEGIWWENEAKNNNSFKTAAAFGVTDTDYALMPLPHATAEKYEEVTAKNKEDGTPTNVLYDQLFSLVFVKRGISAAKKPLAIEFIKFCNSDEQLVKYSLTTNTVKSLTYEIPKEQLKEMTPFGQSIYKLKQKSDVIYPFAQSKIYINNQARFHAFGAFWSTTKSQSYQWATEAMRGGVNAKTYFEGLETYNKNYKWL